MRYTNFRHHLISYVVTMVCMASLTTNVILSIYSLELEKQILEMRREVITLKRESDIDHIEKKAELRRMSLDELYERLGIDSIK